MVDGINGVHGNQPALRNSSSSAVSGNETKMKEDIFTMSRNQRKAWVKEHKAEYGSKAKAREAFDAQYEKMDKMSRKEAKAWCKDYMEEHGCSKKDAKAAFKEEFGYSVPLNLFQKMARTVVASLTMVGYHIDTATDGKLGIRKFTTGESNNDAAYVKRETHTAPPDTKDVD